jgi:hypothetical protein
MRLKRLRLRDFQRHRELDVKLSPGVTVLRGPNEAGKSTVQRALELALFKRCTAAGREIDAVRRWGAEADAAPWVEIEFEEDGVHGRLTKRFAGTRGTVELLLGDELVTDPAEVDRRLAEMTGLPSDKFFRSTASVHHQELADLDRDEAALRDRLEASMSGADRGTSLAKKRLEEAIRRYTTEGPKNPGHLKRLRDEIATLESELATGEAELARLERDQAALSTARAKRTDADARFKTERANLAESERAVVLQAQKEEAQARYERFRRAADLRSQIAELEATHPSQTPLPALRNAIGRLRRFEQRISEIRAELVAESDASAYEVKSLPPRWEPWAFGAILLAFAALATGGAALNIGAAAVPIAIALGVAAVVCAGITYRQRRKGGAIARQNELAGEQIARRLRGRSELEQELVNNERARNDELARLRIDDTATAEAVLAAETDHAAAIDKLNAEYRGMLGDTPPVGDIAVMRDQAAAEAEQKVHALAGMGEIGSDPAGSRERYRASVEVAQKEREEALAEEAHAQARVEQNPVDAEQVAAVAERITDARERLLAAERRLRIYDGTLKSLLAAEQATIKKAARFLEQRMGADVARITAGRYRRVSVDEDELTFRVWSPERPGWVDVRDLSQGTLDQFYLAARLGLVRQVTQDRRPPLLFDDPFLTFDDKRAAEAVKLLRELASDHQMLFLTCSDRYDSVADSVVELPAPEAVAEGDAGERHPERTEGRRSGAGRSGRRGERAEAAASSRSPKA